MKTRIYRYESDHDILMIKDDLVKPEIWLNTLCFGFIWRLDERPSINSSEILIDWFIDILANSNLCYINLMPRRLYECQEFVQNCLESSLNRLQSLTKKDFEIYEKLNK